MGVRMGDWIEFRGQRRFVVGVRPGGLVLRRLRTRKRGLRTPRAATPRDPRFVLSQIVFYNVSAAEKKGLHVIAASTAYSRSRARKLLATTLSPWTTIVWKGDDPTYVHDPAKFPKPQGARKASR